ncbi:MAG: nitrite reductase small subunit NirD [Cytophagaceae bacterium]
MTQVLTEKIIIWHQVSTISEFPENGGSCIKIGDRQIAIFNFSKRNEWYATQNLCPHKMQMILSRGMIGDKEGEPKVACPFHKKSFSLKTGECLSGEEYSISTYPVKIENGFVYVGIEK